MGHCGAGPSVFYSMSRLSRVSPKFITTFTFAIVHILKMFQYKICGYKNDLPQHNSHALLQSSLATANKQKPQTQRPDSHNTILHFAQNLP